MSVRPVSHGTLLATLTALTAALFLASLAIGYAPLDLLRASGDALRGDRTIGALVLVELRLPRALLGLLVGFTLGLAGAVMQGFLRNPLAEPGVVGVSGGAALGAVLVFYSGLAALSPLILPSGGILAALVVAADGAPAHVLTEDRIASVYGVSVELGVRDGVRFVVPWRRLQTDEGGE